PRWAPPAVPLQPPTNLAPTFVAPSLFFALPLQFSQGSHQLSRDKPPAVRAKATRHCFSSRHSRHIHGCSAFRTAATNAFILTGSFLPGSRSMPETTSTPQG